MQNLNEIRRHVDAIEQTKKITNAMQLVSSSRMKRVMQQVEYNRTYGAHVKNAMAHILTSSRGITHPYLQPREKIKNTTYIVISGDKGMVGAYNNDVLKLAKSEMEKKEAYNLITVGITASRFFEKQGITPDIQIIGVSQDPSLYHARHIVQDIFRFFDEGLTDEVYVIHTSFINSIQWYPKMERLLPITWPEEEVGEKRDEMIYHPSPQEVFDLLVPQYTVGILYGALLEAYASEHSARMQSMQSATNNAEEMLDKLKTTYNLARQAAITQEISEIVSAAQAANSEVNE